MHRATIAGEKRRGLLKFIAGSLVMSAATIYGGGAWAADPIKIGSVLSVTGPGAFLGDPELKTIQLYIEKINDEGGVLGRKLQLVHYDDGSDANKANAFGKRLIEDDKVDIIVGGSLTGSTMAMVPLVEKAGVPFISLAGAVVIVDPVKKWVFKTPHTDRLAVEKIFEDLKKRNLLKVGVICDTAAFGQSACKETRNLAPRHGIQILAEESYGAKDTDMTPQLTKIRNTAGVQAVINHGFGQGPAIVTKNYRQLGITLPFYQSHGVASEEYIRLSGGAAEGVKLPAAGLVVAEQLPANDPQKPVATSYRKAYLERYKQDVSTFGGHAYDGLMLAINAIKKAGGTDKEKVRDAVEQTKGYMGTSGTVNMSPTDHMGLDLSAFRMVEVKNNEFALLY